MRRRLATCISALIILGALFTLGSIPSFAAVPDSINYQGILKTAGGSPVPDGSYGVTFKIYDVASGPNPSLWTETKSVATVGGLFTTLLGSVTPLPSSVFSGSSRYLGIAVSSDPEMTPRTAIVAVAYAYRIGTIDGATGGSISGDVAISGGDINLDPSSATSGNILKNGVPFIHDFGSHNTFIGRNAGNLTMSGTFNTATGSNALQNNTSGGANTASGTDALASNTTGNNNTASGVYALMSNTFGVSNTASGRDALLSNINGSNNTANGVAALHGNTGGDQNTASGRDALYTNTFGEGNTATGVQALYSNTTGYNNTASGARALLGNTIGSNNTAIGHGAGVSEGDLTNATAIGADAVVSASNCLVLGNAVNVGIGTSSPTKKLEVAGSIKVGASDTVFSSNLSSNSPLSLQAPAGTTRMYIDDATGHVGIGTNVPEGSMHIFKGSAGTVTANPRSSGIFEASGENYITILGPDDSARGIAFGSPLNPACGGIYFDIPAAGLDNGFSFRTNTNDVGMTLDASGNLTAVGCVDGTNLTCPSDARFKRDIVTIPNAIDMVGRLRGVHYQWQREQFADRNFPAGQQIGLIAQEVQKVVPQAVVAKSDGYLSVDYSRLVPVLIEGMKEQQKQIDAQKQEIDALKTTGGELQALVQKLALQARHGLTTAQVDPTQTIQPK